MALHLARRQQRFPSNPSLIRFLSNSSSESPPGEKPSQSTSSLSDIKSNLKQKSQYQEEQGRKPFERFDAQSQNRGPIRLSGNQSRRPLLDLGKNLANFERRSTFPPPRDSLPSQSRPQISLEALYKQKTAPISAEPRNRKSQNFNWNNVWDNLKNLNLQTNTPNSFKTISKENFSASLFEGAEASPKSVFGKEMDAMKGREDETEFLTFYSEEELGEKLRMLRPEGSMQKGLFSLEELNQRLVKLRQLEEKEAQIPIGNYSALRNAIGTVTHDASEQNLAILGNLGAVPEYKLHPPKDALVETYFHQDNLSSAEKMKIELTKVREEFKMSESDCGSARVQVAQLTTKIKHLSSALHKKDKHSRKGLVEMVQRRKKLLKYLRRTDWDSYCLVLSKLGLRDKQEDKYKNYAQET